MKTISTLALALFLSSGIQNDKPPAASSEPGPHLTQPVAIVSTLPAYPREALRVRAEGQVMLSGVVRKTGRVDRLRLIERPAGRSGQVMSQAFADQLVRVWRYRPGTKDGEPVDMAAIFSAHFNLTGPNHSPEPQVRSEFILLWPGAPREFLPSRAGGDGSGIYRWGSGNGFTNPVPLVQTPPMYTTAAINAKVHGVVWLRAIIRKNGKLDSFKVIKGLVPHNM